MRSRLRRIVSGVTVATLIIAVATLGGYGLRGLGGASQGNIKLAAGPYPQTWIAGFGQGFDSNSAGGCQPIGGGGNCMTITTALGQTAAGGEISSMSPSQTTGPITITKSVTINGMGVKTSVLEGTGDAITINAGPNDVVVLRNLEIEGAGIGANTNGIVFNSGKQLVLDNVTIQGFTGDGVKANLTTGGSNIVISNSRIFDNGSAGVAVSTSTGSVHVNINHSSLENNAYGVMNGDGSVLDLNYDVITGNSTIGLGAQTFGILTSLVHANDDQFDNNPYAVWEYHGAGNAQIIIWLSNNEVVNNAYGIYGNTGGTLAVFSFGNNRLANNAVPGGVNGVASQT